MKADRVNKIPKTIEALKSTFSDPRLVWKPALKLSPAPKAPPMPVPVCCRRMEAERRITSPICINGNAVANSCI